MGKSVVLYVEDEEYDVFFMRRAFQKAGLEEKLQTVVDGQEAIDYLAGKAQFGNRVEYPLPAVLLLDLNLPIIPGFEVLQWIRQNPELRKLPVVVFSSSARPEDKAQAKLMGADEYIQKPASALEFASVVNYLKKCWMQGAEQGTGASVS